MDTSFRHNMDDMLDSAEQCLAQHRLIPGLVLIYSNIDATAWASLPKSTASVRRNFEAWTTKWLLPHLHTYSPEVSAVDLYAARCAALHSHTGTSDLSESGKAKQIYYAWGAGSTQVLRDRIASVNMSHLVVPVHISELLASLRASVRDMLQAANSDPDLSAELTEAAELHYGILNPPTWSKPV